jgi:hypothetical protein
LYAISTAAIFHIGRGDVVVAVRRQQRNVGEAI